MSIGFNTLNSFKVKAKKGEWLPGLPSPAYLNGSLPGDNGFDPLGLAEDPENLKWYVQAEPEVFTKIGIISMFPSGTPPARQNSLHHSPPSSSSNSFSSTMWRSEGGRTTRTPAVYTRTPSSRFKNYSLPPNEVGYPGGIFNPLNFTPTVEAKEKEIADGRLAMLAFLGFVIHHTVTGQGHFDNLLQHLSDPWHNTIIQTLRG